MKEEEENLQFAEKIKALNPQPPNSK